MFRPFFLIVLLTALLSIIGCNDKSTEPTEENTNYLLPLTVGNTWNYKLYSSSSDFTGQITWTITQKITLSAKEYYLITMTGSFGTNYYVVKNEDDGLFLSRFDSTKGLTSPFFFKYKAQDEETYQYQIPNTDSTLFITVKKQKLSIGNEVYNCYGYINKNFNPYFPFMYFAKNVGLVRHKLVYSYGQGIDTSQYFVYDLQNKVLNE